MIHFPKPLKPRDLIAVTAPSSGVPGPLQARLDLVLEHLRSQGYRILEGQCLRHEHKDASAPKSDRAHEFIEFLNNPDIAAIIPPWGGELATELLDLIPFATLRQTPPQFTLINGAMAKVEFESVKGLIPQGKNFQRIVVSTSAQN
ncbi:LD-carboxypeptidase [Oscillatoria sp. CS-180]|uniref:LD-carboxypeptidase n=1 Tax=Oscillatoria sp. CS-180 TaxID=3021720 RepID=UPI002331283C|nr:LD-carboxypeptidase [Oscillatoria sp. CS-180]MDB9526327.1 LD-carboxypeptidase [Oscillatoria sp. CS-180]